MVPAGYMAKRVSKRPEWLHAMQVEDIYSVSGCCSENFADYIEYWKHNEYWLFDSPKVIRNLASEHAIDLQRTRLFYYDAYEKEFDGKSWNSYRADPFPTGVEQPEVKQLEGFDVATFFARNAPECSPLSCNSIAEQVTTNRHCLFGTFKEAEDSVLEGVFNNCEPGPYRIFSVYSVDWS